MLSWSLIFKLLSLDTQSFGNIGILYKTECCLGIQKRKYYSKKDQHSLKDPQRWHIFISWFSFFYLLNLENKNTVFKKSKCLQSKYVICLL